MEVILNITVEKRNPQGDVVFQIKEGTRITVIRWEYLPDPVKDEMREVRSEKQLRNDFYIFYYRGYFLTVNKLDCHVNRWEDGKFNI